MLRKLVARQFKSPTGLLGRYIGNKMARENVCEIEWTISLLNIQPHDHVLEIGFGPGVGIQLVSEKATEGLAAGVDVSSTMVQAAQKRNLKAIQSGLVQLKHGDVSSLPFGDASFDKAFSIHCIYFWPEPSKCFQELRRVLKPGGLAATTILRREIMLEDHAPPADIFTTFDSQELTQLLSGAGFREVQVELSPDQKTFPGLCVIGVK